ncbi:hypothetical protein IPF37_04005 [bacterium]|nr:MAG: hypothetical protein IPF37_04005 [bacterium]
MKFFKLFSFIFLCLFSDIDPEINQASTPTTVAQTQTLTIDSIQWGKIIVNTSSDSQAKFKDCICTPQGAKAWDWGITGMSHNPGIGIAEVKDLVDQTDVFVLSRGVDLVLQVQPAVVDYLKKAGKTVMVARTINKPDYDITVPGTAVYEYNKLVQEGKRVVGLFHSTC